MAMEISQIKQKLSQVDQIISRAAQAIKDDKGAPQELKDYVHQLGTQSRQAKQKLKQAQDETVLIRCVDDLEKTSNRAKQVCDISSSLGAPAKLAVQQAYLELNDLKDELH
jgi:uncharacterized phage infection (PIP) family protein YhgE